MTTWTDTLDDRQRKEIALARLYAQDFAHGTDGHSRLMLISALAELLDQAVSSPPLGALVDAARSLGAAGTWVLRGATGATLLYTDAEPPGDVMEWHGLELTPPHQVIVLIRIPALPGGPDGIEFHGPNEE